MTDVTKDLLEALKHCQNIFVSYAIDRIDGEEISDKALAIINAAIARAESAMAEPQADADGWIPWAGGECPLADGVWHRVRFRDGYEPAPIENPLDWRWTATGLRSDIIAYRIVTESGK